MWKNILPGVILSLMMINNANIDNSYRNYIYRIAPLTLIALSEDDLDGDRLLNCIEYSKAFSVLRYSNVVGGGW